MNRPITPTAKAHANFYSVADCVHGKEISSVVAPFFKILIDSIYVLLPDTKELRLRQGELDVLLRFQSGVIKLKKANISIITNLLIWTESEDAKTVFKQQKYLLSWLKNCFQLLDQGFPSKNAFQFGTAKLDGELRRGQPPKAWTLVEDLQRLAWLFARANSDQKNSMQTLVKADWSKARKRIISAKMVYKKTKGLIVTTDIDAAISEIKRVIQENENNVLAQRLQTISCEEEAACLVERHLHKIIHD